MIFRGPSNATTLNPAISLYFCGESGNLLGGWFVADCILRQAVCEVPLTPARCAVTKTTL